MSVNKYRPHVFVIPEDDADRQLVQGFELDVRLNPLALQVMPPVGGWREVVDKILDEYVSILRSNSNTHVVGIMDCDEQANRIAEQLARVPQDVHQRVFLLGTIDEPEDFKRLVGLTFEKIGTALADECFREDFNLWAHSHFGHIKDEVLRAKVSLRPILFL